MNTYNLKKMCAVSVASIMCVSALAFSGCGDKKAEVSQTPDETTPATTAVSTADEPTAQNYLESIGIDTSTLGINPNIIHDSNLLTAFIEKNSTKCYDTDSVPDSVKKLYEENGGNPYLDGAYNAVDRGYTVFAQVIDGMDVVDKIASAKVDKDDIPVKNIVIKSIKITQYKEESTTQADSTSAKSVTQPTTVG